MVVQVSCMVERTIIMGGDMLDLGRKIKVRYEAIHDSARYIVTCSIPNFLRLTNYTSKKYNFFMD